MPSTKADIIARLQRDILPLQGYRSSLRSMAMDVGLGPIKNAFPNAAFPLGAIHEFCAAGVEETAASGGFIAGILSALMRDGGAALWIGALPTVFPPALASFGIAPERIIFIDAKNHKDALWAMEEALKCNTLAAVVGELPEMNFTASRRLQLAVEQSRVTGFVLRRDPRYLHTTACIARWKIVPLPGEIMDDIPGVGFPRWQVELLKVRNGKPGSWTLTWKNGSFRHGYKLAPLIQEQQKKTG